MIWHCAVLVLLTWISGCAAQYTYDVYPIDTCPASDNCLTLSDIVNERYKYFTSNVILLFHSGDHRLQDKAIFVVAISNLALQGTSSSSGAPVTRIVCDNSFLSFSGVSDLHVTSISFISCRCTLFFTVSLFQDCSFENGTAVNGGAMAVYRGSSVMFLGHTAFTGNTATLYGGAIYADDSTITFSGKTTFAGNHAHSGRGGAVYAEEGNNLSFSGTCSFDRNTAAFGSAVYAREDNTVSFSGNSSFQANTAEYDGGALYAAGDNHLSFSGNSSFEENTADYGSALYANMNNIMSFSGTSSFDRNTAFTGCTLYAGEYNILIFSGTSSFKENTADYGGALCAGLDNTLSFIGSNSFERNTAEYFGGALFPEKDNTLRFIGNNRFEGNTADYGGALSAVENNTVSFSGTSNFDGNTAELGGALYVGEDNTLTFSGTSNFSRNTADYGGALCSILDNIFNFSGNSSFKENTADCGGALYAIEHNTLHFDGNNNFEESTMVHGGALYAIEDNTLNFSGNSSFQGNTAENDGGALYAEWNNTLSFIGNNSFERNTADRGGAIYALADNSLKFSGNSTFQGNTANYDGGAVYAEWDNRLTYSGNSSFQVNTANYGGALYAGDNNTLSFSGNSSFNRNTAENLGGALDAEWGNTLSFSGITNFEENMANYGGALYANVENTFSFNGNSSLDRNMANYCGALYCYQNNTFSFSGNNSFKGNTAEYIGGSWYARKYNTLSFIGNNSFERNTADRGGAIYALAGNSLKFSGNSTFQGNTANYDGGAVYAEWDNSLTYSGNSSFQVNTANYGGALYAGDNDTLSFSGYSSFNRNTAENLGGALDAEWGNTLSFSGITNFEENMANYGGALYANVENTFSFNGNSSFDRNMANYCGALYCYQNNTFSFSGNNSFKENTAEYIGGAWYARKYNTLSFSGNNRFERNTVLAEYGGALYAAERNALNFSGTSSFKENKASTGGSLYCFNSEVRFAGRTSFFSNTAEVFGGALYTVNSVTQMAAICTFRENQATSGGGIFVQGGRFVFQGKCTFIENSASQHGYGGAILAISSIVAFNGSYQIVSNTAGYGGGVALVGIKDRTLLLEPATNIFFYGNAAHKRGGALYVEDNPFTYCNFNTATETGVRDGCFIQLFYPEQYACVITGISYKAVATLIHHDVSINFENNTAVQSGNALYGGDLDSCGVCVVDTPGPILVPVQGLDVFRQIANASGSSKLEISSDPYRVCICINNHPYCNQATVNVLKYPGETLSVSLVSVGQTDGPVPSVIRAESYNLTITSDFKVTQPAERNKDCTELHYPLLSGEKNARLKLYSDEPCSTSGFPLTVHITFLPCPVGFTLSDQGMCICEERLQKYTQNCMIETLTIRREHGDGFWAGLQHVPKPGLILHPHCPFDYCTEEAVDFTLNSTDLQCSPGRSGVLCGGCQSGRTLALGSSQCLYGCFNKSLALLLAFAAAGVVLVAFLFLCRVTIAGGTLSGLIFYANILAVNQSIFFPAGTTNVLTVFIAWLNLDLGIETCFFVDLDAYSRTWLQFVFPIYIWVLVGLVIYLADVTTTFARIIGRTNPVAVLATLFLLSYTKLLRAIMAAFSFTTLDYPDNESRFVWLYDGNIGYLDKHDGKHIVLFLVSLLVFLFVFLPYTVLLLCGQWIQRKFQLRWLSPTKQLYLKAFLDAHYAPFHDKHRYWTGLLLLLRFFIVLLSTLISIESPQDPFVSLAVLLCVVSGMLLWAWLLYKKWYLNILEVSFMFNLIVLIGGTYQIRLSGGNQAALAYTSVSIAFVTFIGIVISTVIQQCNKEIQQRRRAAHQQDNNHQNPNGEEEPPYSPANVSVPKGVTCSVVDIADGRSLKDSRDIELTPI